MTAREIVSRLDEIDIRLDALVDEIDRAEIIWGSLEHAVDGAAEPRWLTEPYVEQDRLLDEYWELSRQFRHD